MPHVREVRILCRKSLDLFSLLLLRTQETGARRTDMTQDLLALVTGLAHYLRVLIRIALTGALKLEREHDVREAMRSFLDKLHLLAVQGRDPSARRMLIGAKGEAVSIHRSALGNAGTNGVMYGFRSLAPENVSIFGAPVDHTLSSVSVVDPPSPKCPRCNLLVEEGCVRLGTYKRWHSRCLRCKSCRKVAGAEDKTKEKKKTEDGTARRSPINVDFFVYDVGSIVHTKSFGPIPTAIYCMDHAHQDCRGGFQAVSRLEQYAYLLWLALRELYMHLKKHGLIADMPTAGMYPAFFMIVREARVVFYHDVSPGPTSPSR
jgi:hypothetical protein